MRAWLASVWIFWALPASATFHLWVMDEAYSSADGTVQFVELSTSFSAQQFVAGHTITASNGSTTHSYTLPTDLPGDSAGRKFLIGTQTFAALNIMPPDYIVPDGFFFQGGGTINWASADIWTHGALPADGASSLYRDGSVAARTPTNFAASGASAPSAPAAPGSVSAVAGNAQATVSFMPPPSNYGDPPISFYTATCSPLSGGGSTSATGSFSPITVMGLVNGTTYTCAVTATNSGGTGASSAPSSSVIPTGPPGAPTAVSAAAGEAQATVGFTAPASNGGLAITSYSASCAPLAGGTAVTRSGSGSPIVVTPLANGTAYSCTVTATNSSGVGAPSAPSNTITPKRAQTIAFSSTAPASATAGGAAYVVAASATSGLPVSFSISASSAAVCSVSGATVSFSGGGVCEIDANQGGDATFGPAPQVSQSFTVTGPALGIGVRPSHLDFDPQSMGTISPARVVTVTNVGSAPLTISTVTVSVPAFAETTDCTVLAAGASCSINVTFDPPAAAGLVNTVLAFTGSLAVASNAPGSPQTVDLAGTSEKSLVSHYYRSILRRAPDAGGKQFWQDETVRVQGLGANVNETWYAMAISFYASAEYAALNRDDSGFVEDLYETFFDRAPDAAGLAYWSGQLGSGMPREVALASFMFSAEFGNFTTGIFGNTAARAEVDTLGDLYRGLLARLPDSAGFNYWITQFRAAQCQGANAVLTQVEAISSAFANSGEYGARGRGNSQYVADLYAAFLRRGGDLSGVQFWIGQLDSGARSRDQMRRDFIASPEFSARVDGIIAQGCLP